jgi:Immunoglobulin-like domain of bacterial spore germination
MTKGRLGLATLLGALSVGMVACSNNASNPSATSTTVSATTSTTSPESSTWTAVWPTAASSVRYRTPEAAAKGFATDYLHMVDPVISQFQQGDARSGEVPVQSSTTGPVTTVLVRELGSDNSWWVLGAGTAAIALTEPVWNASITSPVTLKGTAMAFEGTVQTQVREDDKAKPLGQGYVTGGSTAMGPFSGSLAFTKATTKYGAVVLYTTSAENGAVMEASVIRVQFG